MNDLLKQPSYKLVELRQNQSPSQGLPIGLQVASHLWKDNLALFVAKILESHYLAKSKHHPEVLHVSVN